MSVISLSSEFSEFSEWSNLENECLIENNKVESIVSINSIIKSDTPFSFVGINSIQSIHSLNSTQNSSINLIRQNYEFGDFEFKPKKLIKPKKQKKSEWTILGVNNTLSRRRRKGKELNKTKLETINENMTMEKCEKSKIKIELKNLNKIIKQLNLDSINKTELLKLVFDISNYGIISLNNYTITLSNVPFLNERIREELFKILILKPTLNERRYHWSLLDFNSKLYLIPLKSILKFNQLFMLDKSVKISELLSIDKMIQYNYLIKPEWVRIVLKGNYIQSIKLQKQMYFKMVKKAKQLNLELKYKSPKSYISHGCDNISDINDEFSDLEYNSSKYENITNYERDFESTDFGSEFSDDSYFAIF